MITFENEDEEYFQWLERSETGFVFNEIKQHIDDPPLILHTARCGHLWPPDPKKANTHHKKMCSRSKTELLKWTQKNSTEYRECPDCKP